MQELSFDCKTENMHHTTNSLQHLYKLSKSKRCIRDLPLKVCSRWEVTEKRIWIYDFLTAIKVQVNKLNQRKCFLVIIQSILRLLLSSPKMDKIFSHWLDCWYFRYTICRRKLTNSDFWWKIFTTFVLLVSSRRQRAKEKSVIGQNGIHSYLLSFIICPKFSPLFPKTFPRPNCEGMMTVYWNSKLQN